MQHLEALFDRALDAVVGMDHEGRVIAWNGSAEAMFGRSRPEAMGAMMDDLIVPQQYRAAHAKGLAHYLVTGEGPVLEQRVRITALDCTGAEFPVELSILPVAEADAPPVFYAFIRSLAAEEAHRHEQEARAQEAEILLRVAQKLLEEISFEEFTQYCLQEVCEIAGLEAGHLFVARGAGAARHLAPSGIWHLRDTRYAPICEATEAQRFTPGIGLPGRAWAEGRLVVEPHLPDDANFLRRDVFEQVGLTRGIALPILHSGEMHAVLEFYGTAQSRLDPAFLRMLQTVGSHLGLAIRRKEGAERRETLRRELIHRVGNSLTVLSAIYRSCARQAASIEELSEAFLGRVAAVGQANRMAIEEAETGADLAALIRESIGLLPENGARDIEVPDLIVDSESVMPLSLVFHELATNALKYGGFGEGSRLAIRAIMCPETDELVIDWWESRAAPLDALPENDRSGFGSQLIRLMVERRLGGGFSREVDAEGCRIVLRLPRARIERQAG
ncbi:MAG: GAF domain-containing protein [Limimaricola soesokkakensis]|uniref:GAF domain-containing protein n=1 Tax=Limimaricola soesokkakensis TaxID=1343159 RepID=UPI00405A017E